MQVYDQYFWYLLFEFYIDLCEKLYNTIALGHTSHDVASITAEAASTSPQIAKENVYINVVH